MRLSDIFKSETTIHSLNIFDAKLIAQLEASFIEPDLFAKPDKISLRCLVRDKEISAKPEEIVRQLWLLRLMQEYGYPKSRLAVEYPINFGRDTSKRADIVIFDADRPTVVYLIIETKAPKQKDGKEQLKSYCHATGAPLALWSNGAETIVWHRKNPNYFIEIPQLPTAQQTIEQVVDQPWTIETLLNKEQERENQAPRSLRQKIADMEDEVLANAGVDVFEEVFKLIFTKLYDELACYNDTHKFLRFRNVNTAAQLKANIQALFDEAKKKWHGVFHKNEKIKLTADHLQVCVASLEEWKLFNSNLDVIDDAFEYLVNKSAKGEKGQYFTPRWVIDMCVKMLNPQADETLIDTACGSAGFTVHGIFHVWKQILHDEGLTTSHLFTMEKKPPRCYEYVRENVFAIDFDEKSVRVARCLNLIAGDGQTNVLHLNTLDWTKWEETTTQQSWIDTYNQGWIKLRELLVNEHDYRAFQFDVLMANPPFAGDIKQSEMLSSYELAHKVDKNGKLGKLEKAVGRDILFIERNLDFLKPGGRMAVVLPQGRFNNSSDQRIREFIAERCRILAVVGLQQNTFKPHTGTKTSVLFIQKWNDDPKVGPMCPRIADYSIFFATQRLPSKDNSGDKIIVQRDGKPLRDSHGHWVVQHDLFNHEGLTQDGIAEAFIEFAKKERLSFFEFSSFNEAKYKALLEGLEISEVKLSELEYSGRLDSEYYHPVFLQYEKTIKHKKSKPLSELCNFLIGPFGSAFTVENYTDDKSYRYIRGKDVKPMKIMDDDNVYMPREDFERLSKYALKENDVLVSVVGTLGNAALIQKEHLPAIFSCKSAVLRVKRINAVYLLAYINSKYGHSLLLRKERGAIQKGLNLDDLKTLDIYIAEEQLQLSIEKFFELSLDIEKKSKSIYLQAENLLLEELGLTDWQPSQDNIAIKTFSQSFLSSGRLDAEYYQPKYDELKKIIFFYGNYTRLGDIGEFTSGSFISDEYYVINAKRAYIRIKELSLKEPINSSQVVYISDDYKAKNETVIYENEYVIATIGNTIGKVNRVTEEFNGSFISNNTSKFCLNDKSINCFYFEIMLRSKVVQMQIEKEFTQTAQPKISDDSLRNIIVPLVRQEIQQTIAAKIQQSFALKKQSEHLLHIAKRAVEIAIETNEQTAMDYIYSQTRE